MSVDIEWSHLGLELFEPTKRNFMISNIISRAACLAEVTSNPKSFFNCPDMHGGPGLPEDSAEQRARHGNESVRLADKERRAKSGELGAARNLWQLNSCGRLAGR